MPHIKDAEKVALKEAKKVKKMGELCFLFSEGALAEYAREPRWNSIHNIARALFVNPYHEQWSHDIIQEYTLGITQQDIKTAAFLALLEFYRIIGAKYEDGMIAQNGNALAGAKIPSLGDVVIERGQALPVVAPPATPESLTPFQEACVAPETAPEVTQDVNGDLTLAPKRGRGRPKNVGA